MKKCPNCQSKNAIIHPLYGATVCVKCQKKRNNQRSPGNDVEFTSDDIKSQRVQFADDVLQPYRSGQVSKKYIQKYGTKNLDVTEKEVKEAMEKPDVWSGDSGHDYYRE